jgi:hypothetical protein
MIQRSLKYILAALIVLAVIAAAVTGTSNARHRNRPATTDGCRRHGRDPRHSRHPPKAQVLVAVNDDQKLTDNQLSTLSRSASAQIVQVILPDCLQEPRPANRPARTEWPGHAGQRHRPWRGAGLALVVRAEGRQGPGHLVDLAWKNPAAPTCCRNLAHGHWLVAWNDNPDDTSAGFVRDQPNAETSISDYDINLPQVLNNELRKILVGGDKANGGLAIRWLKCRPVRPRTP